MSDEINEGQRESKALVAQTPPTVIQTHEGRGLNLTTLEDMFRFAKYVVASGLAPKGMEKPESVLLALEMGAEVGLAPMQSIQNIAVINGRTTIWGDAVPGLVHGSGKQEWYSQKKIGQPGTDNYGYEVASKRKGNPEPIVTTFTVADAKKASLWTKAGPWTFYPDRMLLNRARAFNARDNFPDVLKGMYTAEEIQDIDFEVLDSKPLEDGDKTNRLAEKLAKKEEYEAMDSNPIPDVVNMETEVLDVFVGVPSERKTATEAFVERPGSESRSESRSESSPESAHNRLKIERPEPERPESRPNDTLPGGQKQALIDRLGPNGITMADLRKITKELGIKFGVPQNLTEEEAARILEKLS